MNKAEMIIESGYAPDGLWLTVHRKKKGQVNKMDLMTSLAIEHAPICHLRRARNPESKNTICTHCYSYIQSSCHPVIRDKMSHNTQKFNDSHFKPSKIKTINNCLRYISFGEIQNPVQAINILRHAKVNRTLNKAIWTKMFRFISEALKTYNKPVPKLNLIWSCSRINCMKFLIPKNFTKSFYVYKDENTREAAIKACEQQGIKTFKCLATDCKSCLHCYENHDPTIVMEILR